MTDVSSPLAGAGPDASDEGADELRERLLRAAAAVFARQGYDGTKIMDIVRESGLSTGAVYGRFRSKNDLLREAIVTRSRTAARSGADGLERVADIITALATRTAAPLTDAEALRLEAYVTARREPEVAGALAESYQVVRERLAPLVAEARTDGTVADDVDADAVLFLVRILNLGLLLHRGSGLPGPDPDAWQSLVGRLVASFGTEAGAGAADAPIPMTAPADPQIPSTPPTDRPIPSTPPTDTPALTTGHPEDQR